MLGGRQIWSATGLLLLCTMALAGPQDRVFFAGNTGSDEQFLCVFRLSDGTVLIGGAADDLSWVPAGVPTSTLSQTAANGSAIDNTSTTDLRYAFIAHCSADLATLLRVMYFPQGKANEVRHIRANTPPFTPTGDLYISGSRGRTSGSSNTGYFIAKLNANFVSGIPTQLSWVFNCNTNTSNNSGSGTSEYYTLQPWDVQSDGKVMFVEGVTYGDRWAEVVRLKSNPLDRTLANNDQTLYRDAVPGWRLHAVTNLPDSPSYHNVNGNFYSIANNTFYGEAPPVIIPNIVYSQMILKYTRTNDAGLQRSFTAADYMQWAKDENGYWRRGKYPMDGFWNAHWRRPETIRDASSVNNVFGGDVRGYDGHWYRAAGTGGGDGSPYTPRVGTLVIDKRNNHSYLGINLRSYLPEGQPDFEPYLIAMDDTGRMKWWARLYKEYDDNGPTAPAAVDPAKVRVSTPDQYIDALAIDYSQPLQPDGSGGRVYVVARTHGNNVTNFWNGNQLAANPGGRGFQNGFTGNNGNAHYSWIGKYRCDATRSTIERSTYFCEYSEQPSGVTGFYSDPNLRGWPDHNAGWPELNTTDVQQTAWVDQQGRLYTLARGRRTITTHDAYQRMTRPGIKGTVTSAATANTTTTFASTALMGMNLMISPGCVLTFNSGVLNGQNSVVAAINEATGQVTLASAVSAAPAANQQFTIREGVSGWNMFVRVWTPQLDSIVYSSLLTGVIDPANGSGADNTDLVGVFPADNGVYVVGKQDGDGNAIPVANAPAWGRAARNAGAGTTAMAARLTFGGSDAIAPTLQAVRSRKTHN